MKDHATPIGTLIEKAEEYSKTTIELLKLQAVDKSADVVSSLVSRLAILLGVTLSLFIINIGIALWIGDLLGKSYYGFLLVGGFYVLLMLVLRAFRHTWIKLPVSNSIIAQMLKQKTI